jgi:hypothetical protein
MLELAQVYDGERAGSGGDVGVRVVGGVGVGGGG